MRLEITIDGDRPTHFPVNKEVLVIGSGKSADIRIEHIHVSRKHLSLHVTEEHFFIEDLGSTNGSFVNNERLAPNKRLEFTSFFPVRVGSAVYISLVSEADENEASTEADPFKQSLEDMAQTNETKQTQIMRGAKPSKTSRRNGVSQQSKTTKSSPLAPQALLLLLLILVVSYLFYNIQNNDGGQLKRVAAVQESVVVAPAKSKLRQVDLITDEDFLPRTEMQMVLARVKCTTDRERALCESVVGARGDRWGATVVDEITIIAVDGTNFYEEAKKAMPVSREIKEGRASLEILTQHEDNIWKLATSLFIKRSLSRMPYGKLKEELLVFGLYKKNSSGFEIGAELVANANQLENVSPLTGAPLLNDVIAHGPQVLGILDRYFRIKSSELQ